MDVKTHTREGNRLMALRKNRGEYSDLRERK
jgi:hypothetical protein